MSRWGFVSLGFCSCAVQARLRALSPLYKTKNNKIETHTLLSFIKNLSWFGVPRDKKQKRTSWARLCPEVCRFILRLFPPRSLDRQLRV